MTIGDYYLYALLSIQNTNSAKSISRKIKCLVKCACKATKRLLVTQKVVELVSQLSTFHSKQKDSDL